MSLTKNPKPGRRTSRNRFLFSEVKIVPIDTLNPHPDNPNIGDVEAIRESLRTNGMYRPPVVVNLRNGFMAAGHHTWLAARAEGWDRIGIVEIGVSDEEHLHIMLADNEVGKKSSYNEEVLDRILHSLTDIRGTGFTDLDVEDIHTRVAHLAGSALASVDERRRHDDDSQPDAPAFGDEAAGEDDQSDDAREPNLGDLDQAADTLPGALTLKSPDDMDFERVGYWGIPRLRTDMLMRFDELPATLETWAGSATKDWPDPDTWWLYNYGVDSTSGMRDVSKMILSFYCWDEYFEKWWHDTDKYTARALNCGVRYAIAPNFSQWPEDPHALNLWNLYRSRLIARYFQEVGIKVIPDVNWPYRDEEFLIKHVLATLPTSPPMIAMQMQTYNPRSMSTAEQADLRRLVQLVFDTLKPGGLLLYAGRPGRDFIRRHITTGCPIRTLETRTRKLSVKAAEKQRRPTL